MPRFRGSSFPRTNVSNRRKTGWFDGPGQVTLASVTVGGSVVAAVGSQALNDGLTLVRLHGMFTAWLEVVTTIGDGFSNMSIGICVVSENAAGVGVTAIPTPILDQSWDGWWFHQNIGPLIGLETTEVARGPLNAVRIPIASKSMRKIRLSDFVVFVLEVNNEIGAATMKWQMDTRMLAKLP